MQLEKKIHYWTQEEDNYIKENYLNMSDKEISENLQNRSERSVKTRRCSFNLMRPRTRVLSKNKSTGKPDFEFVKQEFKNKGYVLLSDESEFKNMSTKLRYKCLKHEDKGELLITYSHFKQGRGCYYCGKERTIDKRTEKFTDEIIKLDKELCTSKGLEYVETKRVNGKIHIFFICEKHKDLGVQHMARFNMSRSADNSIGCKYCNGKDIPSWYIKKKVEELYPNYEVISEYNGMNKPLTCFCKKHNLQFTHDAKYIFHEGQGCELCTYDKKFETYRLSDNEIINKVNSATPNIDLIDVKMYRGYNEPLDVRCNLCGNKWTSTLASIVVNKPKCPFCSNDISKGEQKIINYCKSKSLNYSPQYTIPECRYKKPLKFDVAILGENNKLLGLIEYQGEQHYNPIDYFGGEEKLKINQLRDSIKRDYCKNNNIQLLEIPYWDYDNISIILDKFIEKVS